MKKTIILLLLLFVIPTFGTVPEGETTRQSFACDGVTTTFTFTFACNSSDDVVVYAPITLTGFPTDALTIDTDYSIAPTGGSYLNGGVVTIAPALASTYIVFIERSIKISQETSSGAVSAASLVLALDKLTREVRDMQDRIQRSLHIPGSDATSFDMVIPNKVERSGTILAFNTAGNPYAFSGTIPEGSTSVWGGIFVQAPNAAAARVLMEVNTEAETIATLVAQQNTWADTQTFPSATFTATPVLPTGGSGLMPVGSMSMYAGATTAPSGWLLCQGQALQRSIAGGGSTDTYKVLWDLIGTTYGVGDGATTFNLPDMNGRVPLGEGLSTTAGYPTTHALAEEIGAEKHVLLVGELASHSHVLPFTNQGLGDQSNGGGMLDTFAAAGQATDEIGRRASGTKYSFTGIESEGDDDPHNNLQPSLALNFIIKY